MSSSPRAHGLSDAEGRDAPAGFIPLSKCAELGFQAGRLPCSTCSDLSEALGAADALAAECASCCSTTLDFNSARRYDGGALHVCVEHASTWGGINEWLEKSAKKWEERGVAVVDDCEGEPFLSLTDEGEAEAGTAPAKAKGRAALASLFGGGAAARKARSPAASSGSASMPVGTWKVEQVDAFLRQKLVVV